MGLCSCACECAGNLFRIITTYIVGLLQLAICTAIICIIAINLSDYEVDVNGNTVNYSCMLQPDENGRDVCVYGYVASGVSMGATLFFMLTVCCTCSCYTILGMWLDLVLAVLGVLWWIAAAAVFSAKGSDTTGETDAQQSYRSTIYGLSWTMVALFAVFFLFHLIRVLYTLCHCCACCVDCCGGDSKMEQRDKNKKQRHDEEAGKAPLPLSEAPRPYVAPTHAKPIAG